MEIIKVINNNNVCIKTDKGKEQIVSGKGIGYAKKPDDTILPSQIQKTYMITDSEMQKRLIELLTEIPEGYIKFSNDLVEYIKNHISWEINDSLLISLADHIYFAIKRKKKGIEFNNPMLDSLRTCYPEELNLGYYCINEIERRLKIKFNLDEAGFIAMHIINARLDPNMSDIYNSTKLINGCLDIVLHIFPDINKQVLSYERFMVHIKYLTQRVIDKQPYDNLLANDDIFLNQIKNTYTDEYKCAKQIEQYILETSSILISDEELITITIHLARLNIESKKDTV